MTVLLSACGGGTEDPGDTTGEVTSRAAASTSASAQSEKPQASAEPRTSAKALSDYVARLEVVDSP